MYSRNKHVCTIHTQTRAHMICVEISMVCQCSHHSSMQWCQWCALHPCVHCISHVPVLDVHPLTSHVPVLDVHPLTSHVPVLDVHPLTSHVPVLDVHPLTSRPSLHYLHTHPTLLCTQTGTIRLQFGAAAPTHVAVIHHPSSSQEVEAPNSTKANAVEACGMAMCVRLLTNNTSGGWVCICLHYINTHAKCTKHMHYHQYIHPSSMSHITPPLGNARLVCVVGYEDGSLAVWCESSTTTPLTIVRVHEQPVMGMDAVVRDSTLCMIWGGERGATC